MKITKTNNGRLMHGAAIAAAVSMAACGTSHGFSLSADGGGLQSSGAAPAAAPSKGNTIVTGKGGSTRVLPAAAGSTRTAARPPSNNIITGANTVDAVGKTVPLSPVTGVVSGTLRSTGDAIVRSRSKPDSTRVIVDGKGAVGMVVDEVGAVGSNATGGVVGNVNKATGLGKLTGKSNLVGVSVADQRLVGSTKPAVNLSILGKRPPKANGAAVGVLNQGRAATVTLTPTKK